MKYLNKTQTILAAVLLLLMCSPVHAKVITVIQKDKEFKIDMNRVSILEINKGDIIKFENDDPFFHNVYSMSDLKMFDLGSYKTGLAKSVTFDKSGSVDVECAIHPRMILHVNIR